jgi:hypothetical protein
MAAAAARKRNLDVTPVGRHRQGRVVPEGLQLGFSALELKEIRRGVREPAIALEAGRKAHRGSQESRR